MRKLFVAGAALLLVVVSIGGFAQTTNATLGGTVSDPSRALIPGVTVTATNTQTGIARSCSARSLESKWIDRLYAFGVLQVNSKDASSG